MGGNLSANFEDKKVAFTVGCWKVIDAKNSSSNEKVSLWMLDPELLKKRFPDLDQQNAYTQGFMRSVQVVRKLRHPRLLKILEVQEGPELQFVSEPVKCPLKTMIGNIDSNDSLYIGFQLLDALKFIHNDAKSVHFGVSPISVFLTSDLSVKLFNFNWCAPVGEDGTVELGVPYNSDASSPNIRYTAPEVIEGKKCSDKTDIFSFGATFCEMITGKQVIEVKTKEEYPVTQNPMNNIQGMTSSFYTLLQNCMQPMQNLRPTAAGLMQDALFQSVNIRCLRYLDLIVAKDPKDKFEFFKNISRIISSFSKTIIRQKIVPTLINECHQNEKFAPILIGPIVTSTRDFEQEEFTNEVYLKIFWLTKLLKPPQILIGFLQQLDILIEKVDMSLHAEKVYPILYSSLRTDEALLMKECLKRLPSVLPKMDVSAVTKNIVPLLVGICKKHPNIEFVGSALSCLKDSLSRVDNDMFMKYIIPDIHNVWKKYEEPYLIPLIWDIFDRMNKGGSNTMAHGTPLAADIAAHRVCPTYYQQAFASWILSRATDYKQEGKLDEVVDPVARAEAEAEIKTLFDPLAEELSINPSQQNFEFDFSLPSISKPQQKPVPSPVEENKKTFSPWENTSPAPAPAQETFSPWGNMSAMPSAAPAAASVQETFSLWGNMNPTTSPAASPAREPFSPWDSVPQNTEKGFDPWGSVPQKQQQQQPFAPW